MGKLEAENVFEKENNLLKITNHHLVTGIQQLDKKQPRDDCCIRMSRGYAERLIKTMKKVNRPHRAQQIQAMIDEQIQTEITEITEIILEQT